MKFLKWFLFGGIVFLLFGVWIAQQFSIMQQEEEVFCASLKIGMEYSQVMEQTKEDGAIAHKISSFDSTKLVFVGFPEPHILHKNTYLLSFHKGKYSGIGVITKHNSVGPVCCNKFSCQ